MSTQVLHEGVVCSSDNDSVTVLLSAGVSCSGCQAEKSCGLSGSEQKKVTVTGSWKVRQGEKVIVSMDESQGFSALFLGYILPLLLLLLSLVILVSSGVGELISGLISIMILFPYYTMLFLFRKRIGKKYTFTLKTFS